MPNWKKLITSGSNASLSSLFVTNAVTASIFSGSFTGSLFGTASYASYALTASSAQNASDILLYVKNSSGAQINKGKVVRITGAVGDNALIGTASYKDDNNSANTLGITYENIANDSFGYVITEGTLLGINTDAFTAGQLIYLGDTGSIIGTAPVAPLHAVRLGQVLRSQLNNGSIYVRIDNGFELGELHDVKDTTTTGSYGDLLVKSGSIWINSKQLTGSYGLTGSLQATSFSGSFTGSLFGTASWANNVVSTSFASTASNVLGGAATYIPLWNSATTLSSSVMYQSSSNIGIGTITPSSLLHIKGGELITEGVGGGGAFNNLYVVTSNSDARNWAVGASVSSFGDFGIKQSNAKDGSPVTAGTTRLYISNTGNVGIGTTSPASKLEISGSNVALLRLRAPGTGNNYILYSSGSTDLGYVGY